MDMRVKVSISSVEALHGGNFDLDIQWAFAKYARERLEDAETASPAY
jgi:hypothetical protein